MTERSADILGRCAHLVGYLTWNAAEKAIRNIRMKPKQRQDTVRPVRCRFCSKWHLGRGDGF